MIDEEHEHMVTMNYSRIHYLLTYVCQVTITHWIVRMVSIGIVRVVLKFSLGHFVAMPKYLEKTCRTIKIPIVRLHRRRFKTFTSYFIHEFSLSLRDAFRSESYISLEDDDDTRDVRTKIISIE